LVRPGDVLGVHDVDVSPPDRLVVDLAALGMMVTGSSFSRAKSLTQAPRLRPSAHTGFRAGTGARPCHFPAGLEHNVLGSDHVALKDGKTRFVATVHLYTVFEIRNAL
jgi:hypothetical protein